MAVKRASEKAKSARFFGQARKQPKMFRSGPLARSPWLYPRKRCRMYDW
jgi:hypothetical protein